MVSELIETRKLPNWIKNYPEAIAPVACAVLTFLGWLAFSGNLLGLGVWLLVAAYIIGGYENAREGVTTLWQEHELDVDLLMIIAALGAAILGLWQEDYYLLVDGAVLILIFATSGALEHIAMQRTERNIRSLMELTPDNARLFKEGREMIVPTEQLQIGDRVLVKPGEMFPTDGIIQQGFSTVNQAPITGESIPVEKQVTDEVFAGTINGNGALTIELHKPPESSLIQRVIQLVEEAKTSQPPSQQFLEQFERRYARVIIFVGVGLATLPPLVFAWDWETTIYRALVFLVVASPCALMAAIMPTLLSGIARGARDGILFKDGAQLETIGKISAIAFDKTGTLTTGQLQLKQVIPSSNTTKAELLQIAASLEAYSEHPIGDAILQAAEAENLSLLGAMPEGRSLRDIEVLAKVGQGIIGQIAGKSVTVGKKQFVLTEEIAIDQDCEAKSEQLADQGCSIVWVVQEHQLLGILAVADQIHPQAQQLLAKLKEMGIKETIMLTGDQSTTAQTVAASLCLDRVNANLLPEDKVEMVKELQNHYTVAMVGDGINDAPALAQADVGIAMGGIGSDVALETADIVLMADRLGKLEQAIRIGKKSQRITTQNITLALTSISLLMIANFLGELTLPAGVFGHEGSTLLVTLNGLRLLKN
ncbi:heavy metal translocating P-type ATPase [Dactylococcopsis salina]|uniref:Heavy metal translocating P-type ATPase n=1 Tax=Dactylococcopsis salina (strain PCC 8305) TaxID=13035 RepID=K9YSV2_DACS8|nr:heavy metal translocating P-type ATPase [Dactylococcopsis salina]AFZ49430.1 heavy metal translocating P-type ATPase [Dactylococcopsis salina PCC 8305]